MPRSTVAAALRSRRAVRGAVLLLATLLATSAALRAADAVDPVAVARDVLAELEAGKWEAVTGRGTPEVQAALPPLQLGLTWQAIASQAGPLLSTGAARSGAVGDLRVVVLPLVRERGELELVVTVDPQGRLAGLVVRPPTPPEAPAPSVIDDSPEPAADDPIAIADRVLADMRAHRADRVAARFDEVMAEKLTAEQLGSTWDGLGIQVGALVKVGEPALATMSGNSIVTRRLTFERAPLELVVVVDPRGRVSGLRLRPAQAEAAAAEPAPPPADAPFRERPLSVGDGPAALPGTLTIPSGAGPFPAVVLVHGSGPNDRDESVGANKPFRDLAWGLARRGIAVLRYEKRTKAHPEAMAALGPSLTVVDETIDDAVRAVHVLRAQPEVDAARVFVAGHSLGAMVGPRIAERVPLAGLVLLAAPSRPLGDLVLDQMRTVFGADGEVTQGEEALLAALAEKVALSKSPDLTPDTPAVALPLGMPAPYVLDLRAHDPVTTAERLGIPVLVVQGGRDYQVTMDDFARWRQLARRSDHVRTALFHDVNHLLIPGEGPPGPAEYDVAGHVSERLIDEVGRFVRDGG